MFYAVGISLIVFLAPHAVVWVTQIAQCHPMIAAVTVVSGAIYTAAAVESAVSK